MFEMALLKPLLISLAVLSTARGQCPFAGSMGAANEAAIAFAREAGGQESCHDSLDPESYVMYTRKIRSAMEDEGLKQLIRVKREYEIPEEKVRSAVEDGMRMAELSGRRLAMIKENEGPTYLPKNDSSYGHYVNFRVHEPSINLHTTSIALIRATKKLQQEYAHKFGMTPATFIEYLRHHGFTISEVSGSCKADPVCRKYMPYRTLDGSCNNLKKTSWGMSRTPLVRIAKPKYQDAVFQEPRSVLGYPLPSAAYVRMILFPDVDRADHFWTRSLELWGQLMAHDMALSPSTQSKDGPIQCCKKDNSGPLPPHLLHPACYPIHVPDEHPFYSKYGVRCLNFVRTMTVPSDGCKLGPGQQMNAVTSFLDLSIVYGSNDEQAHKLRTHHGGLLKATFSKNTGGEMLPPAEDKGACDVKSPSEACYLAGDVRVNLHPDLTVLHTLLLRWHNLIAKEFQKLNPTWGDERLYQEARKYCIDAYQHVCYNEWLPALFGKDFMVEHGLLRLDEDHNGYVRDYNPHIPPGIINSFTTAAFRYLHSTAQGKLDMVTPARQYFGHLTLSNYYNKPEPLTERNTFHGLVIGSITQPMQAADHYFTSEVNGLLFRGDKPFGLDLTSIDIQRQRDHGLASYNTYRQICGLGKATKWEDFLDFIHPEKIDRLRHVYKHVDDVDLEVGISLESPVKGTLIGPTSRCIIAEQFYRTRVADRYFYMNGEQSYEPAKLAEIKKYTWSKIICETSGGVDKVQLEGFRLLSDKNRLVHCSSLPQINLYLWKE
ncbi:peroxidase-like [Ischnura elegans]|uniref:peroxidase-like n=1 Tax=Ischnura elegans TaxID=197161 RepID=UPI001ED88F4B|nr:peroxidase-like [Ischnura elegans]